MSGLFAGVLLVGFIFAVGQAAKCILSNPVKTASTAKSLFNLFR